LENLDDNEVDINRVWKGIRKYIKASSPGSISCYKLKQHKPWFDEEGLKLLIKGS
jgi:hypothetical protein